METADGEKRTGVAFIPLRPLGKFALVDVADVEFLSNYNWCYSRGYAITGIRKPDGTRTTKRMQRMLCNTNAPTLDHVNGNRLDNRRSNIRGASYQENARNARPHGVSPYKGVSYSSDKRRVKRWRAQICEGGRPCTLGRFKTQEEAAQAYDKAARRLHGDFAYLNFKKAA